MSHAQRLLLGGSGQGWLWLAAGAAALGLVGLLYRYERRLVSRGAGLGLLGLRVSAIGVLLCVLFEPIAERSYRETVRGRVVLGVDVSESMATIDANRPADEARRLSRVLNLSPAEPADILPRREIARRLLAAGILKRLEAEHTVEPGVFAEGMVPVAPDDLTRAVGLESDRNKNPRDITDIGTVLEQALSSSNQAPLLGVVLLSDGQQNGPSDLDRLADRLAARGVPVYPVLVGSTVPPRDAAIVQVKAPEGVYKGDVASIEVTLKIDGFPNVEIPITLERPGVEPMRQVVRVPERSARPVVTFRVALEQAGPQQMTVAVAPPPGDARPDNDRRAFSVAAADDRARVLLVESEPRWEFRYLRNALVRDPRVEVESIVFHQPASSASAGTTYAAAFPPAPSAPDREPDPLGAFDAILLGDVLAADLAAEAWTRLESYVAERGGTLIFSAGPRSDNLAQLHENVRKLLPVIEPRSVPVDPSAIDPARPALPPGLAIVPAPEVDLAAWPMFQLAADPARNRTLWLSLPRLPWVLAGRAKPGATVLAAIDEPRSERAVMASHAYGLGKVLWIGTDGTWRWRYRVGDAYHHRFWGQVVRWAAAGKLTAGNRLVRFGPLRPQTNEGEGVRLQARIAENVPGVGPDLLVAARIFKKGDVQNPAAIVPLLPAHAQPRTFEAESPALAAGFYVIRLEVPQLARELSLASTEQPPEATLEVIPRQTPERIELAARRDVLERLASATGGRLLRDDEALRLPELLRGRTLETVHTEETPLWDKPAPLVLFFVLLTAEWALRKRLGLP